MPTYSDHSTSVVLADDFLPDLVERDIVDIFLIVMLNPANIKSHYGGIIPTTLFIGTAMSPSQMIPYNGSS